MAFADEELSDLRRRINATRWPERETVADDSQGVRLALMQDLARYWGSDYDWRPCEARLNTLPQFVTELDGLDIHFIHVRSQHEDSAADRHAWMARLDHRAAEDHRAAHESHRARRKRRGRVPPGDPLAAGPRLLGQAKHRRVGSAADRTCLGPADEAPRLHPIRGAGRRLGCGRHPGDGRAGAAVRAVSRGATGIRPAERVLCEARGLCADHVDAPADAVRTRGLTDRSRRVRDLFEAKPIPIPYAISVFPRELYQAPRSWAERAYPDNLIYYNQLDRGGHFAAWEQPQLFAEEVRAGFRSLR